VRTIGLEAQLDWLGTRTGHDFDLCLTTGAFRWNEGAAWCSPAMASCCTTARRRCFARVGPPGGAEPFQQFEPAYRRVRGVEGRYLDRVVLRVLRYDNRADPTQIDTVSGASPGPRASTAPGCGREQHGLDRDPAMARWRDHHRPPGVQLVWPFRAQFALLSKRFGRQTLSARYDRFEVDTNIPDGDGWQVGHAWTAAWMFDADAHWRLALEWAAGAKLLLLPHRIGGPPRRRRRSCMLACATRSVPGSLSGVSSGSGPELSRGLRSGDSTSYGRLLSGASGVAFSWWN